MAKAVAEDSVPAKIVMRQDEAFWNAIRGSKKAEAFNLFITTHPDSPYVADAKAALKALQDEDSAASGKATKPSAETAAKPVAIEPDASAVVPKPTPVELIAALKRLGFEPEIPEGTAPEERLYAGYLEEYRLFVSHKDASADVADAELREVMFMAASSEAWTDAGYDRFAVGNILKRAQLVYAKLIDGEAATELHEMVHALQLHFNKPKLPLINKELLWRILEEPVALSYRSRKINAEFGDWIVQTQPKSTYLEQRCFLVFRPDRVTWSGPFLTQFEPGTPQFIYTQSGGSKLSIWYAPGDMFGPDAPVKMVTEGREFPLVFSDLETGLPKFDEATKDGKSYGDGITFLRKAKGAVKLVGTNGWGLPLEITFSADGFTKAFQAMNKTCAEGQLGVWLR